MAKYHSGVPWPSKGVKVANKSAKLTPGQMRWAKGITKIAGKALNVKNR